jgi:hyaluronan synthase
MFRDTEKKVLDEVNKIRHTFAHVYETVQKEALSHFTRRQLIAAEFFKYKKNMDIKDRRPPILKKACLVVVIAMIIFVGWRVAHIIFITDPGLGIYGLLVAYVIVQGFIVSYFFYRDPYQKAKKNELAMKYNPLVSVVIATKNERFVIFDAAHSALNSSYKNLEVCIVNDGSDDDFTAANIDELVKHNGGKVKAKHLATNEGKRRAMRHGFYLSEGEIVIFLDSDTIVEHDAIERLVRCMNDDPHLGAIVGYCRALNADFNYMTKMQDTWYASAFSVGKGFEASLGTVSCCSGILSAYRREAIEPCIDRWAVDYFLGTEFIAGDDRQLTAYVCGGNKWKINKNLKQWKTGYCESALSISETPYKFKKFIRQQIRWEQSWTRVMLFTFPFWYKGRHPLAAIDYYLRMALSYIAPIIAVNNLVIAPLTGHWDSMFVYLGGLGCLSLLFCMDFKLYNPGSGKRWLWRLAFTFMSVGTLYFLLYYSVYTVLKRQNSWLTR